jgi:hypothetical protein
VLGLYDFFFTIPIHSVVAISTTTEQASVIAASTPNSFQASGTIDYTENGEGANVPYLVYVPLSGSVATKALVFGSGSECVVSGQSYPCTLIADALQTYVGTSVVKVTGTVDGEHLTVSSLETT